MTNDNSNSGCATLAAYHGWHEMWRKHLSGNRWWENLHMYGNIAVAEKDTSGKPNVLEAFNGSNGRVRWVFSCEDGNASMLSDTTYHANVVTVTCDRGRVRVDPKTGRQTS